MIIDYKKRKPRLEIINMIDVMLFMLLFFMVFTTFKTGRNGIDVKLPQAVSAKAIDRNFIVITLTRDGCVFMNQTPVALGNLGAVMRNAKGKKVVIKPDQDVSCGKLVEVMDVLRRNNIYQTALAVERLEEPKK
ncbi:MAG: ExbD/TolR family protein [Bacillota bacterium]